MKGLVSLFSEPAHTGFSAREGIRRHRPATLLFALVPLDDLGSGVAVCESHEAVWELGSDDLTQCLDLGLQKSSTSSCWLGNLDVDAVALKTELVTAW